VAAGAVLVASIFSIIIGLMVFLPYLWWSLVAHVNEQILL
jgi:hypothetical protein